MAPMLWFVCSLRYGSYHNLGRGGSCHFGSRAGAPDFWKLPYTPHSQNPYHQDSGFRAALPVFRSSTNVAVSINRGSFLRASVQEERDYLGTILGALIVGNCHV